jgi:S-adenosylmethionine:tRNA ribosyltransferase-isomerase
VKVDEFDFELPTELIAQEPLPRGESRLLVLDRRSAKLSHAAIRDLSDFLKAGDLLVANDTRVFPARLIGRRVPSGGRVECLLLHQESPGPGEQSSSPIAHPSDGEVWSALVHPGQKLKPGALMRFEGDAGVLTAEVLERHFFGRRRVHLRAERRADGSTPRVDALVDGLGHVPLPPYIHRPDTAADRARYQTVFAAARGSVAAPTAGLHFDDALLASLDAAGVERVTITLHVGYGTFKPVRASDVEEHVVDPEPYAITEAAARRIGAAMDAGRRVIAVGTTTTRALEDAARGPGARVAAGRALAEVFIYPGFEFKVISGLLTNFHLPRSSLLMLVAAFAGRDRVLDAYREAIERRYRFYSYGDAMLIL